MAKASFDLSNFIRIKIIEFMPVQRKCNQCNKPTLAPIAHKMQPYNSVFDYKCSHCEHEVEFTPVASLGMQITISLLVAGIFWMLFLKDRNNSTTEMTVFIIAMAIMPVVALAQLWKYHTYPAIDGLENSTHLELDQTRNVAKKPIIWIEKFGILAGLLAPLGVIAIVLGVASIIGYVNFTFFE